MNFPHKAAYKWMRFFSLYGVSILVVLVAGVQLAHRNAGLNSWKGGGFGMYADYHSVYTKLLLKASKDAKGKGPRGPDYPLAELFSDAQLYPCNNTMQPVKDHYKHVYGINKMFIHVWLPVFNPDSATIHLELHKSW